VPALLRAKARRSALGVSLAALAVVTAGILGLWVTTTSSLREDYRHHLAVLARTSAVLVDPALHRAIRSAAQRNGPEYLRAVEPLRRIRAANPEVNDLYTVVRDGPVVRFVLDAAEPGSTTETGVEDQAQVWEPYLEHDPSMEAALGDGRRPGAADATAYPLRDKWGTFMTGWAPLVAANGETFGALGVDVDARRYVARLAAARAWALGGLAPSGLMIVILGLGFYRLRLRSLLSAAAAAASAASAASAAAQLATERERLDTIIQGSRVGTWECDLGADTFTADRTLAAMLGYEGESLRLSIAAWQASMHPDDRASLQEAITLSLTSADRMFVAELRMRHRSGHWLWVLTRGRVLEAGADGSPLRMAGIDLDVSARRAVEEALRESEQKLRSLFESAPVGIALNDLATGRFLEVNDALVGPTGYARQELLALTYWDLTPPDFSREEQQQLDALEKTSRYGPYEKLYKRKDGSIYPVLLSGTRMRDRSGRDVIWSIVQDISQRKAFERELADAASRDKLTGLANRARFMELLERAVKRCGSGLQRSYAVLFLDFDRFKLVNDSFGHRTGDELLQRIAERLRHSLRARELDDPEDSGALISRFGGDEFLILINQLSSPDDASRIAERLLNNLAPAYEISGNDVYATASIGIVTSEQRCATAEDVVRNADVAMYEAKRSGRACAVVFNEAMHTRLARNLTIESELRRAIGCEELRLVFQPIVDLATGRLVSAEALLRWQHPTLGDIPPSEFIPVAEESGLIVALGQWVVREACATMAGWRRCDPRRAPETVSVNVSLAELALGPRLLQHIRSVLDATGLPPGCLQLEITEREVMRNAGATLELMQALEAFGVRLAMDDFGTGTSSLAFLRDFPFHAVKIDRSFLRDLGDDPDVLAVIHATVTLVENLGMQSVAEGIEQRQQAAVLQSLGCRYAQGYLFSHPVPAAQLLDAVPGVSRTVLAVAAG